jgi:hypothetical protein
MIFFYTKVLIYTPNRTSFKDRIFVFIFKHLPSVWPIALVYLSGDGTFIFNIASSAATLIYHSVT